MNRVMRLLASCIHFFAANAAVIHIPADYPAIQTGINHAVNGDTVLVHPGTYAENINFNGKNIVIASLFLISHDTAYISGTVISGASTAGPDKSIVTFENNETSSAKLIGLTLKNGAGNYRHLGSDWVYYGGGVYCSHASPLLSCLLIRNNTAACGGGVFLYYSNSTVESSVIENNVCSSLAQAAPNAGGAAVIWNCQNALLRNNKLHGNMVERAGGAVYSLNSTCSIVNCLITANHSMVMGSAFYADSRSELDIINCTASGNYCDAGAGLLGKSMVYCLDSAKVSISNSIFYNNQPTTIVCQFNYRRNEVTVFHSDFEGGMDSVVTNNNGNNVTVHWPGDNINTNPLFVNAGAGDFHLQPSSPCINTGDTAGVNGITTTDLDANNRFYGGIDMGCYEFQGSLAGIRPAVAEYAMRVYPNPCSVFIFFENTASTPLRQQIRLYNVGGQVVHMEEMGSGQSVALPVSGLPNGIYFLRWTDGQAAWSKKLVLVH